MVEYTSVGDKVIIICKEHGQFEQRGGDHLNGHKCAKCSTQNSVQTRKITGTAKYTKSTGKKMTTIEFIEKAKKVHGNNYNYDNVVYINNQTNIKIKCNNCQKIFEQTPNVHLSKKGCTDCATEENAKKRATPQEEFIKKANIKHNYTYDYSLVKYTTTKNYIIVICKKHGQYKITANSHLAGHSCRKCATERNAKKRALSLEEFTVRANEKHANYYDYSDVQFTNMHDNISIQCKIHGAFSQEVNKHLMGQGCNKCKPSNYSYKSIKWLDYVAKKDNIKIQHAMNDGEYKLPDTNIKVDGFCHENNTVYLFHGIFFHGHPDFYNRQDMNKLTKKTFGELYIKTLEQEVRISQLGYSVVIMWEHDWDCFCKLK